MRIVQQAVKLECATADPQEVIEQAGRTCYRSEEKAGEGTAGPFCRMLIARGHCSVLEHATATFRIVCDRGVSHELVRHRLASYSQESTRFCNYSKEQFGREITVIRPVFFVPDTTNYNIWAKACWIAERNYFDLLDIGATPQEARAVLPNSLKTEIVMTANLREWHHVLKLRTSKAAHPQMRQVMVPLLAEFKRGLAPIFDDIQD